MNTGYVEATGFEHFVQTLRGWALAGDQYIFLAFTTIAAPKQNTPAESNRGGEFMQTLTKT